MYVRIPAVRLSRYHGEVDHKDSYDRSADPFLVKMGKGYGGYYWERYYVRSSIRGGGITLHNYTDGDKNGLKHSSS